MLLSPSKDYANIAFNVITGINTVALHRVEKMNKQLVLDFPIIKNYLEQDFYVSLSNHEAFKTIDSWPKWIKRTVNIYGPSGSGKSHLSSIFAQKTTSLKVKYSEFSEIEIKLPDDNLVEAILSKRLSDKQIIIDKRYMKYAIKRIERSYENLSKFIHMLDKLSLKSGKSINFKVIREVLKKYKS